MDAAAKPLTLTDILALWGAILSTVVLVWDIAKWRMAGPKLRLTVSTGMKAFNMPEYEGKMLVLASVVNYGDRPTTLTHMILLRYITTWRRVRGKKTAGAIWIPNPGQQPLPYELKPGTTWTGIAVQTEEVSAMLDNEGLVCTIYHSHRTRPIKKLVKKKNYS